MQPVPKLRKMPFRKKGAFTMQNFSINNKLFIVPLENEPKEEIKINAFLDLLSKSNITGYFKDWKDETSKVGHPEYNPCLMFATALLSFTLDDGSLRKISNSCKFDTRFIYIMADQKPSYASYCNLLNKCVLKNSDEIFTKIVSTICKEMNIDTCGEVFVDGTKLEANANKYKFVWKPTKKMDNLLNKAVKQCTEIGIEIENSTKKNKHYDYLKKMTTIVDLVKNKLISNGINPSEVKGGKGHRISKIEKVYLKCVLGLEKMLEYSEQVKICGPDRNSYYKTDHDATAMCLKEDYYSGLGSNMHAGYNIQAAVSKGIVLSYFVSQDRADYKTLPPFLEKHKLLYKYYPSTICADSGYGGIINYSFLKKNNIKNYVKTNTWEGEVSGKRPALYHIGDNGNIFCLNNKEAIKIDPPRHPTFAGSEFYMIENCRACQYKKYCKKSLKKKTGPRIFEINIEFLIEKEKAFLNLLSPHGIELRVNRSIQVEGTFGIMKQDMKYDRFRRRGLEKSNMEIMLTFLGMNIRKYLRYISTGKQPEYWKAPDGLEAEKPKKISRIIKKGGIKKAKPQPNELAKKQHKLKK